ncbi:MAG: NAD(P)/FAD-dependent oxidoreductase [Bryobacteraceae bacterium]|jgi:phytoene dehydrogenase-like protein
MSDGKWNRREIIQSALAVIPGAGLDWDALPSAKASQSGENQFDAVIIGAGLGGLSCAAAFSRQGFKPLILEKHDKPGGYATTFRRPGGFVFDVSLHSTTVGERNGIHNLIPGFPEITDVEFVPHRTLYRAIFPNHDIRVPPRDLPGYIKTLAGQFPEEEAGIRALFDDMQGVADDINKFSRAGGKVDMSRFPIEYPHLLRSAGSTWGAMMDARIKDARLKAIVSALWGYYGLPPSKLASFYYALPTIGYLTQGGYYPKGKSQKISDALVSFITARGGKLLLNTEVVKVLVRNGTAYGVRTADGHEYTAKAVVANSNPHDLFHSMVEDEARLKDYLARIDSLSVSLSCFQVFLGLKKDLVGALRIPETEIFYSSGYDPEAGYQAALNGDMSNPGLGVTLYDNLYPGYSPKGKNTVNLITLQGFDHWKQYEADYRQGRKEAYRAEKERIAGILIRQAEKALLPGLSKAIEVKEIGTPLTNLRYTANSRGAIYGWDQTLDNSGIRRLGYATPIRNLFLAGAWTRPGGGYSAVLMSGLQCFAEVTRNWA